MLRTSLLLLALGACGPDPEVCGDGIDNDGDALIDCDDVGDCAAEPACTDADADRYMADEDCDDGDPAVHPGALEVCNGLDDDCDGTADNGALDAATFYADADADGFGDPSSPTAACAAPSGHVEDDTDCDDTDDGVHPDAVETCDGADEDCDGAVDEDAADAPTWYLDQDGDGYGLSTAADLETCEQPSGFVDNAEDCDDLDAEVNPGHAEECDPIDHDCDGSDGMVDEDADGWAVCEGDCDDADASVNPAVLWYADADADGYGDVAASQAACLQPAGYVADATDCDDGMDDVFPGANEWCDGVDHDCDGLADEDSSLDAATWYADGDGDGYGDAGASQAACLQPSGYVADSTDCDDTDPAVNPTLLWYADADGDGWGDAASRLASCLQPSGHVADTTDCDDADAAVNPGATEICNNFVDDDCDGGPGDCMLTAEFDLGSADAIYTGEGAGDYAGIALAGAGDMNADGYADLLIGAYGSDSSATTAGAAYLVLGGAGPADASLASATAKYVGEADGDWAGWAVAGGGDVNADGFDDTLVSALYGDRYATDAGAVYLILGSSSPASGPLSSADAVYSLGGNFGYSTACDGDVDGDGFDDMLFGAPQYGSQEGRVYLVLGSASPVSVTAAGSATAAFSAEAAGDQAGASVSLAGDLDGDGMADILIGAAYNDAADTNAGSAYILLGDAALTSMSLAAADAQWTGESPADFAGCSVSGAGDVNADGYGDILIGAKRSDGGGVDSGAGYLILGAASLPGGSLSAPDARYLGENADDMAGFSVSRAGDVDADGFDDFLLGAYLNDEGGMDAGAAYLVMGSAVPASGSLSIADTKFIGENGFYYTGEVAAAGDVNADGLDDIIVGAYLASHSATNAGAAYLILGTGL
ncbi:MAG: MopE-related protein [Pseudomonadota bacterium]